jgi:PKD repeat protein
MTSSEYPVVLTVEGAAGTDAETVDSNVAVVNTMYQELLGSGEIAPNALRSYFVDFYLTQSLGGGFAQYVFTAPDREELDAYIREGLEGMGAAGHVDLFDRIAEAFDALSEEETDIYLDGASDAEDGELPERVQAMEDLDAEFESLLETEDIVALNAAWLRGQEGLLVLNDDGLTAHIAKRVAALPDLEERRAEAEEEALENAPEFEVIVRELCDIAGYELQKITMGDPNYDHNGETVLAWHFSTDHGDFLMIEDDDEAFMLNPETKEIVAAVEFEELDGDLDEDLVEA